MTARLAPFPLDRLRITSYNIYKARWFERPRSGGGSILADVASLPRLGQADILLLQEAIVGPLQRGGPVRDTVGEMATLLEVPAAGPEHAWFEGVAHGRDRRWGVGVVSRHPATFHPLQLPKPTWSPWQRGAILARVGPWLLGTLHLEVWPIGARARRSQARAILAALDDFAAPNAPIVLAGDFNCERGGPHDELLAAGFVPALRPGVATWSLAGVKLHLDHIYVRGARVLDAGVERGARGSDHWPVWVEVGL